MTCSPTSSTATATWSPTSTPRGWVLTHGEPHRANTVLTATGVVLVDWDTCLLAPRERDLWMLVGEDPGILAVHAARTGTALDPRLLEAFRLRWDLADVESCVRVLRAPHRLTRTPAPPGTRCEGCSRPAP